MIKPIVAVSWRFFHRPWPYGAHPLQEEKPAVPEKLPPTAAEIKVGHCDGDVTLFCLICLNVNEKAGTIDGKTGEFWHLALMNRSQAKAPKQATLMKDELERSIDIARAHG